MKTLSVLLFTSLLSLSPLIMAEKDKHDHAGETAEEHAKHSNEHDGQHEGETVEEHAQHADKHPHEGETVEEYAHKNREHSEHEHGKPHHGGIVAELDHIHHELVHKEGMIYLYAEGLPEASDKVSVHLTVLHGKDKQNFDMKVSENDHHRFEIAGNVQAGDKVVALIKIEGEKPRIVKFEIPDE